MKKDEWIGKLSVTELNGESVLCLFMSRPPNTPQMFFIMDHLLQPWINKNIRINIEEVAEDNVR